jgi:hypothetical protein
VTANNTRLDNTVYNEETIQVLLTWVCEDDDRGRSNISHSDVLTIFWARPAQFKRLWRLKLKKSTTISQTAFTNSLKTSCHINVRHTNIDCSHKFYTNTAHFNLYSTSRFCTDKRAHYCEKLRKSKLL